MWIFGRVATSGGAINNSLMSMDYIGFYLG